MKHPGSTLFLISHTSAPCGVESFARHLARSWRGLGNDATELAISGRAGDLRDVRRALATAETLVVNAPVVAWKRVLLLPLLSMMLARLRGRNVVQILHEWGDLDPRRRAVLAANMLVATHVLYSSPTVRDQHRRTLLARLPAVKTGLVPIPPNIMPETASRERVPQHHVVKKLAAARQAGRLVIGHFGSIYPRKRSDRVLEIGAELKRRGHDILVAYIGDFVRGNDDVEAAFSRRIAELGLTADVLVTGYVDAHADVFAALRQTDALVYTFAEGLTSRRGSVLAALLSGRPVIVNRPTNAAEFDHHPAFQSALATGALQLVDSADDIAAFADAIEAAQIGAVPVSIDFDQCWRDAAVAFGRVVCAGRAGACRNVGVPAE